MATKIPKKRKVRVKPTISTKATSKAIGNIVNINVPQPKKRQPRKAQPRGGQGGQTIVSTQIHQIPVPQVSYPNILGTNNLRNAQLSGNLGLERNNEINNGSPIVIGGNQDNRILSSADRADALMKKQQAQQPTNLFKILNEEDNIETYTPPKKTTSSSQTEYEAEVYQKPSHQYLNFKAEFPLMNVSEEDFNRDYTSKSWQTTGKNAGKPKKEASGGRSSSSMR